MEVEGFWGAVDTRTERTLLFMPRLPKSYAVWMGHIATPAEVQVRRWQGVSRAGVQKSCAVMHACCLPLEEREGWTGGTVHMRCIAMCPACGAAWSTLLSTFAPACAAGQVRCRRGALRMLLRSLPGY